MKLLVFSCEAFFDNYFGQIYAQEVKEWDSALCSQIGDCSAVESTEILYV